MSAMRRKTAAQKKNEEALIKGISEYLISVGALPGEFGTFTLETNAGPLQITPLDGWVACKFKEVERAVDLLGSQSINPHSGKWNWHYYNVPANEAIKAFKLVLRMVADLPAEKCGKNSRCVEPQPRGGKCLNCGGWLEDE